MVTFWGWMWIVLASPAQVDVPIQAAEQRPAAGSNEAVTALRSDENESAEVDSDEQPLEVFPSRADTMFRRVVVGADGTVTETPDDNGGVAGEGERLIYSNILGINAVAVAIGNGVVLADDITTTAPVGCNLTRFRFKVLGRVNPTGTGGPYTVRYALYEVCPQSVTTTQRANDIGATGGGIRIPGTSGELSFPDDEPRLVEVVMPESTVASLPTNFFLGISFTRSNCGTVVGAPAMVGFSADILDHGGAPACSAYFWGFPNWPHASIWAEVFGGANCPDAFVAYSASKASGAQLNPTPQKWFMDDFHLVTDNCKMIGYEVTVRAPQSGFFEFALRRECDGEEIPGTYKTMSMNLSAQPKLRIARFTFDPPIELDGQDFYFAFKVNNPTAGPVMAGVNPSIGSSSMDYFQTAADGSCQKVSPPSGTPNPYVFHASITCEGSQPSGACCDPYLTECVGGPDAGKRCKCNAICIGGARDGQCCYPSWPCPEPGVCEPVCATPGNCEAVCREVPKGNCPFPPRGQDLDPEWVEGRTCSPDVFGDTPCGIAACCYGSINPVTGFLDDLCANLSKNECDAVEPLDRARLWQLGKYCGEGEQACPFNACIARVGPCGLVHVFPGCDDPLCCTDVCEADDWCCRVEWDEICLYWSYALCSTGPTNDGCIGPRVDYGAIELAANSSGVYANINATESETSDPGFCCHNGVGRCLGGAQMDQPCITDAECPDSRCSDFGPTPGAKGYGTIWFKFTATHTSARVDTCRSAGLDVQSSDSLLEVFAVGDPTNDQTACDALIPIACNDDAGSACPDHHNASVYVTDLVPGDTYYVVMASKTPAYEGRHYINLTSPAAPPTTVPGDRCDDAQPVDGPIVPIDFSSTTADCPLESCSPRLFNDVWFDYVATCTGEARFVLDVRKAFSYLVGYGNCDCPSEFDDPLACAEGDGPFQAAEFSVTRGRCYKLRIGGDGQSDLTGELRIECIPADCQPNGVSDDAEIDAGDSSDCNHNGIPDECDLREGVLADQNTNGLPDQCETCPSGQVVLLSPSSRTVDAGQPFALADPDELQGIRKLEFAAFTGAKPSCWTLCETNLNPALHPNYTPEVALNAVESAVETSPGRYFVALRRPITPGEVTTITYRDDLGTTSFAKLISHPGDVNGDGVSAPGDILDLIDVLNGVAQPSWGLYSTDCDRSGEAGPADILCLVDLLNAGWNGTTVPQGGGPCP